MAGLGAEERRFRRIIECSVDAFIEVDADLFVTEWSPAATDILGWKAEEMLGRSILDIVSPRYVDLMTESMVVLRGAAGDGDPSVPELPVLEFELEMCHLRDRMVAVVGRAVTVHSPTGMRVASFVRGKEDGQAVSRASVPDRLHDTLTGLPTRALFTRRLGVAIRALRHSGGSVAVAAFDLDRFKVINDTMGHDAGDDLLMSVVSRLRSDQDGPKPLLARLGGDEFLALFEAPDHRAQEEAERFARRALGLVAEPFSVGGREVYLTASVGIASTTNPEMGATRLLSNTGGALHETKAAGGDGMTVYGEAIRRHAVERMSTELLLHGALDRGELRLYYQPVVDLYTTDPVAVEALIRWQHPEHGLLAPGRFINVAEETGMIIPIGAWALEEACRQMRSWRDAGHEPPRGYMEVNLSARQVDHPALVPTVERTLERCGLQPGDLTLEITESTLMRDGPAALAVLERLKALGVSLAIDDFGTGYSSLSYLKRFPLDILKIDQSFVDDLASRQGGEIVNAVIDLAHALGLKVVAEGVETPEQAQLLRELECDYAQGFLFSHPAPADEQAPGLPITA